MKTYKYTAVYLDGTETDFYCTSVYEAAIRATAFAFNNGSTLKYIKDKTCVIGDIELKLSYDLK